MDTTAREDTREIALKLDKIYEETPEDYYYIKGYIHGLLQKNHNTQKEKPESGVFE